MSDEKAKETVKKQFGAYAAAYVTSPTHAKGWSLARLVEVVQPGADWQALDVATGAGHTAFVFAPHVAHVVASDLTPQMLETAAGVAQERGIENISYRQADAENMPFDDQTFDLVTCRIAPHHFPNPGRFLTECARVLKPGGMLGLVDNIVPEDPAAAAFVNTFEKIRDPSHGRCLSRGEWERLLGAAGFALTHFEARHKIVGFARWTTAQNVSDENCARLLNMLANALAAAGAFMAPNIAGDETTFRLLEGMFVGRKARNH